MMRRRSPSVATSPRRAAEVAFAVPAAMRSKSSLPLRTTQSASAVSWDTLTSPFSIVTYQCAVRPPPARSKRNVPELLLSSGTCPRAARSAKNCLVGSLMSQPLVPMAHAAVHVVGAPGDVSGFVGGQEDGEPRDSVGLAEPAGGDQRLQLVQTLAVAQGALVDPRGDRPRSDVVDGDPVRRQLLAHRAREHAQAALGGRVGGVVQKGHVLVDGGDVDDATARPALHHVAGGRLRGKERPFQVHAEDEVVVLLAHVEERLADLDAGVVHQDVEVAEGLDGGGHEALGFRGHGAGAVAAVVIVHGHVGALAGKAQSDGLPDAARAPRHQGFLAVESHRLVLPAPPIIPRTRWSALRRRRGQGAAALPRGAAAPARRRSGSRGALSRTGASVRARRSNSWSPWPPAG